MVADSWLLTSLALSSAIAAYGFRKCSLDKSGAVCAMLVGFCSFFTVRQPRCMHRNKNSFSDKTLNSRIALCQSAKFGFVLIAFFLTSSKITKIGSARKRALEEDFKEGGQRTWSQVRHLFAVYCAHNHVCIP